MSKNEIGFKEILGLVSNILKTERNIENIITFFEILRSDSSFCQAIQSFVEGDLFSGSCVGWVELCTVHPRHIYYIYENPKCYANYSGLDEFKNAFSSEFTDANFEGENRKYQTAIKFLETESSEKNTRYKTVYINLDENSFNQDTVKSLSSSCEISTFFGKANQGELIIGERNISEIGNTLEDNWKKYFAWLRTYSSIHNAKKNISATIPLGLRLLNAAVHIGVLDDSSPSASHVILALCNLWENIFRLYSEYELQKKSIKSAIGAIMSRNGSHNIGSHVLAALTQNVGTMPDDRVLYQYLQQRMDYIATVTTDIPTWGCSTMFVGDIMRTFFSQRHLLEYISGSEGLRAYCFQDPNLGETEQRAQTGKIKLFIRRIHKNINNGEKADEQPDWSLVNEAGDNALHFICYADKVKIHSPKTAMGKENIHFINYYKEDSPFPLEHDVALAIPGGVIGEHAFFTILENIIRNAAKHGWSAYVRKAANLEIYIDFIDNPDNDYIEFTIWDNMSDVLYPYRLADQNAKDKVEKLLPEKSYLDYLSQKEIEKLQKACRSDVDIDKKVDIKNLPLHWQLQLQLNQSLITEQGNHRRENWGLAEMRISAGYLQHRTVGQIGGLEPLERQVYESQEKEERKNAIDTAQTETSGTVGDEGATVSAQTASVQVESKKENDYIILPVAVPGVCNHLDNPNGGIRCNICMHHERLDCPICNDLYHLGYRFNIPKPREMLIVLTSVNAPDNLAEFKKKGVYFAYAKDNGDSQLFKLPNELDKDKLLKFNYGYVVFPDETTAIKCGEVLLPNELKNQLDKLKKQLRELSKTATVEQTEKNRRQIANQISVIQNSPYPFRLLFCNTNELKTKKPQELKNAVYKLWLDKLKNEWPISGKMLTMQLQTEGSGSGGGRGLITDRDLLDFVFRNNFHSVIINLLGSADMSNALESNRGILRLLACYPSPADEIPQLVGSDIGDTIAQILRQCCEKLQKNYSDIKKEEHNKRKSVGNFDEAGQFVRDFVVSYLARINADSDAQTVLHNVDPVEFKVQMEIFTGQGTKEKQDDFNALDIIFGNCKSEPATETPFSALVDSAQPVLLQLAKALFAVYQITDTLLRKYEERIVTLPRGYSVNMQASCDQDTKLSERDQALATIGIKLGDNPKPQIKYCRHDKRRGEAIYAEALSGSQSYLNTLHRALYEPDESSPGLFVRLAENALIRLLIIDERVSNFLNAHPANRRAFEAMNIYVAEITNNIPSAVDTDNKNISISDLERFDESPDVTNWDMLIIHQGIIDKWFPGEHKEGDVSELIRKLQTQIKSARVVVTTGRGRPDNIPDWVKILPFSMLESTLFHNYPEKMLLVDAVMNALPNQLSK